MFSIFLFHDLFKIISTCFRPFETLMSLYSDNDLILYQLRWTKFCFYKITLMKIRLIIGDYYFAFKS